MTQGRTTVNAERARYIEELTGGHTKRELEEIAKSLNLCPGVHASKRAIAEEILKARELEETSKGLVTKPAQTGEVIEEVVEVSKSTVRGKIRSTEKKAADFKNFAMGDFQNSVKAVQESVQVFNHAIKGHMRANEAFIKTVFNQNLKVFQESIKEFKNSIDNQSKEQQNYIRQFYG